jgi:hypothetical protein
MGIMGSIHGRLSKNLRALKKEGSMKKIAFMETRVLVCVAGAGGAAL